MTLRKLLLKKVKGEKRFTLVPALIVFVLILIGSAIF